MTRPRVLLSRLRALALSRRMDRELDDEIEGHLAEAADELERQGMSPEEARRTALRRFGGVTQTREVHREMRSFACAADLGRDVRYGLRALRRTPTYTAAAAATLALAIGAGTAMFSVVNAVLLRPLPYRSPERLAMLWTENPAQNVREGRSSLLDVDEWRRQSRTFEDLATFDVVATTITGAEGTEQLRGVSISPNLLPLLGVSPMLGRNFSVEEAARREALILVSHEFWQARFGGGRDALGATVIVNGRPAKILGVLPPGFRVANVGASVWHAHPGSQGVRGPETWFVIGRLRPGAAVEQAQAEMSAIARRLTDGLPAAERRRGIAVVPLGLQMVGRESRLALWMLAGAVGFVFLIAAANVTSLTLARAAARAREMAVRAALGASAGRIARQLLTESLLLAGLSGVLGAALAAGGVGLIRAFGPGNLPGLTEVALDARALAWALAISTAAGLLVGLAPAATIVRRERLASATASNRSVSASATSSRLRRVLVAAEFALAIVLLVGAGLLVRSWLHVTAVDPGFRPERVLVMDLASPPAIADHPAQRSAFYQRVLEEIQALPGVEAAGITGDFFIGNSREQTLTFEGAGGIVSERLRIDVDEVSPDFFRTLGTPLLRGRFFSAADDADAPRVAIVNEAMAQRAWPGRDPVGQRFRIGPQAFDRPWYTVVGVVGDMRRQGHERDAFPQVFEPLAQSGSASVDVFVRASTDETAAVAAALRSAVGRVDRNAPVAGITPLEQQAGGYLTERRFQTAVLAGFAVVALVMAAVGIYGLIQYSIATRTREIGLRMAVGAQAADIFRMMIGEGLTLCFTGIALGLVGAWWLGRAVSGLLFGVAASDLLTFGAVSLLLTAVAVAACYLPARRAARVDPTVALRVT